MVKQAKSLNQALLMAMDNYTEKTCFYVRRGRRFQRISYGRFLKLTFRLVNFIHQHGLAEGERVAIIADNPLEWMVVYVACLLSGRVVVPLRAWLPAKTLQVMVRDSGACLALVQGKDQSQIITEAGRGLPDLKNVLVVEEGTKTGHPEVIPITTILAKAITAKDAEAIRTHAANISPQALALIYYKTHNNQGVVFDHARRLATMQAMAEWFTLDDDDVAMSTRLSWSLYTLDSALHYFLSGIPHVLNEGTEMLGENLTQTTPTVNLTTPSGFEEFYDQTLAEVNQWPPARQALFQWALGIGKEYRAAGLAASEELRDKYVRADRAVFSRLRSQYGGTTITRVYSTGAPLPTQWAEFAEIIGGFHPLNIYSLTEAGGFPAVNRPDDNRSGSSGQVAPGFQVRIADDGEVWVRGSSLMCGYWQRPAETQKVLDADGWLHTGDLGHFDKDGYLYLTGHKEASLLLSSGRKVTHSMLRNTLIANPFISQVALFGEGRLYVSALIVPNLAVIAAEVGEPADNGEQPAITVSHPKVREIVDKAMAEVNSQLDSWTRIREYRLLAQPFTEATGELTDSQKICYEVVNERYAAEIESMYPMTMPVTETTTSQIQLDLEELRELLEKQDLLDAWLEDAGIGFLFDLAGDKQIDLPSMVNISDTAAAIAQMQSEEKPLSTALIVGDPVRIARILPESEIQLHRYDHIRRMRQIVISMAKMVDGMVLGYAIGKQGHVQGIHKLEVDLDEPANYLLGPQFRHHAAISQQCDAVVLFVPSGGRQVRVFAEGQLVGRYSNGNWSAESIPDIDKSIARLAEEKNYSLPLLQRVLSCAFQMSEKNLGAIFILGDADAILERSDPPEISAFATIASADMDRLSDRELINFAKQDGATVIDVEGKFRGCMVLLRPDANTQAEIGPGKGARHSSAAKMSAEAQCLAVVVSQDGPITIYDSGQRVVSL
jgi:long-chain acyl-CoA synthetase